MVCRLGNFISQTSPFLSILLPRGGDSSSPLQRLYTEVEGHKAKNSPLGCGRICDMLSSQPEDSQQELGEVLQQRLWEGQ